MSTQIILLERVENLGAMGDIVTVKPGYARNFLLPQAKALRATKENIAYYETQKAHLVKANAEKKADAEKVAKAIEGKKVILVRQAAEGGQLFGSVSSRDIADELAASSKQSITRGMVALNQNFKTIGLFPVDVVLHPEVKVKITVNVARSEAEAEIQAKTGKAVIADSKADKGRRDANLDDAKASMLEEGALAAEKAEAEEEAKAAAVDAEKAAKKASKKAAKTEVIAGEEVAEDVAE
ncbi:MAG TPA: 50S ribosomal protein L9 [Micavibrio sp.]|nr:50S ribosomal protein L9 [Micavibrio sp.]